MFVRDQLPGQFSSFGKGRMSLELLEVDPEQKGQEGLGRISDYVVIQAMTSLHKDVPIRYLVPHQP